jgi:hypothetical protein
MRLDEQHAAADNDRLTGRELANASRYRESVSIGSAAATQISRSWFQHLRDCGFTKGGASPGRAPLRKKIAWEE